MQPTAPTAIDWRPNRSRLPQRKTWSRPSGAPHARLIEFVKDRPGHDRRYAMDARKIAADLDWRPAERFETGLRKTVEWYLEHMDWVQNVTSGAYRSWLDVNYANRGAA